MPDSPAGQLTRIVAIRHGETAWNVDTRIQGQLDVPLNDKGLWQARRLGQALADEGISAVYSSDLQRALQTAQSVAAACDVEVVTDTGLRERSFGVFEGLTWAEIERDHPIESERWRRREPDFGPAGGEMLADFYARSVACVSTLAERHPGEVVAMVAHGGVLDCLYRAATRLDLRAPRSWQLGNASINRLLYTPQGLMLVGWADTGHLDGAVHDEFSDAGANRAALGERSMSLAQAARVGDAVSAIDTPALVIDLDALERNIGRMAAYARAHGMRLRPHAKTHKSAAIAKLQIAAGAVGVCVQKLSEAMALARAGVGDIYISNEVIDAAKLAALAALAGGVKLSLAVDSALGVDRLAVALKAAGTMVDVFVEVDVGHGRCGVAPAAAVGIAHQVVSHGLRFAGLQAYHGRAQHLRSPAERETAIRHAVGLARAAQASVTSAGIACPLVTGAGTGTFVLEAASGLYGELQAGSYVFMDRDYADNHAAPHTPDFEHALFVKSQVMSAGTSHVVVDAGHKSHAIDSGLPRVRGLDLEFVNGGDEHGILRRRAADALPALGDTVWLIPGHCDPTVNLHDHYVCVRGGLEAGRVEALWPVDARGCIR